MVALLFYKRKTAGLPSSYNSLVASKHTITPGIGQQFVAQIKITGRFLDYSKSVVQPDLIKYLHLIQLPNAFEKKELPPYLRMSPKVTTMWLQHWLRRENGEKYYGRTFCSPSG